MRFSFRTGVLVAKGDSTILDELLRECEVECEVVVDCESHGDEVDLLAVGLHEFSISPPDHPSAVKAIFLMPAELREELEVAALHEVEDNWDRYCAEAYEALVDLRDAAMEERYDRMRDR